MKKSVGYYFLKCHQWQQLPALLAALTVPPGLQRGAGHDAAAGVDNLNDSLRLWHTDSVALSEDTIICVS